MFRLLKNGDRLAKTIDEKFAAIEGTKKLMNSDVCSELFDKAKIHTIKGEYNKTLKVFEEVFNEFIEDRFASDMKHYFEENDILTKFEEWEKCYRKYGYHGFFFCIGQEIYEG